MKQSLPFDNAPPIIHNYINKSICPVCKEKLSLSSKSLFLDKDIFSIGAIGGCDLCYEYDFELECASLRSLKITWESLTFNDRDLIITINLCHSLKRSEIVVSLDEKDAKILTINLNYIFLNTKKKLNRKKIIEEVKTMMILS